MPERVFFRGGPLHGLTRTLKGQETGADRIADTRPGRTSHAQYRRTTERQADSVVYQFEEGGAEIDE